MPDRKTVVGHLCDCLAASKPEHMWVFVRKDIVEVAIALLNEQEATIKQKDKEIEGWIEAYNFEH